MKNIGWVVAASLSTALAGVVIFFQIQLNERDQEILSLNQQYGLLVEETNRKLQEASLPEVPVSVAFRGALLSSGSVARITNTSGRSIAIKATTSRPSSSNAKVYELVLDGGQYKEIGELEGWAFVSDDTISIEQAGHKGKSFSMK